MEQQHHHHSAPHNFYALPYLSGGLGMGHCIASLDQIFFVGKLPRKFPNPWNLTNCAPEDEPRLKRRFQTWKPLIFRSEVRCIFGNIFICCSAFLRGQKRARSIPHIKNPKTWKPIRYCRLCVLQHAVLAMLRSHWNNVKTLQLLLVSICLSNWITKPFCSALKIKLFKATT